MAAEKTRHRLALGLLTVFSGAVGKGTETRSYQQNRRAAFVRMANTKEFKAWHRLEAARRLGQLENIERTVDRLMAESNIKVEYIKPK